MAMNINARLNVLHGLIVDGGKPIEFGFHLFKKTHGEASDQAMEGDDLARFAFFCGAQHLFATIMLMLEEDSEMTEGEGVRLDKIHAELQQFAAEYRSRFMTLYNPDVVPVEPVREK
jgi:hypothetical protein